MKANGGMLVIDDFGRQLISPRDLLNRWIVPLDRRVDYLSLNYGVRFQVPFEVMIVFATNLEPSELADEAFLRRIPNKILVDAVSRRMSSTQIPSAASLASVQNEHAKMAPKSSTCASFVSNAAAI